MILLHFFDVGVMETLFYKGLNSWLIQKYNKFVTKLIKTHLYNLRFTLLTMQRRSLLFLL